MTTRRIDLRPGVTEPVVLMFPQREVEAGDPGPAIARLNALLNSRETIWRYRGQVALVVDGYEDDPRELVDVPEVRTFLARFTQAWLLKSTVSAIRSTIDASSATISASAGGLSSWFALVGAVHDDL